MSHPNPARTAAPTAGPWKANSLPGNDLVKPSLACAVWTADGKTPICKTRFKAGKDEPVDPETQDANARLIASAPELLAALKTVQESLPNYENTQILQQIVREALTHATTPTTTGGRKLDRRPNHQAG